MDATVAADYCVVINLNLGIIILVVEHDARSGSGIVYG